MKNKAHLLAGTGISKVVGLFGTGMVFIMSHNDELFEVVDEQGKVLRLAKREECHRDPRLIHRVVHVLVFNSVGHLLMQKRGLQKDIQPGKWDTSVGGHLHPGEKETSGAEREMQEELGIYGADLKFLYHYLMRSPIETELVTTFKIIWDQEIIPDPREIAEARFWSEKEIEAALGRDVFTPNFEDEYRRWKKVRPVKGEAAG